MQYDTPPQEFHIAIKETAKPVNLLAVMSGLSKQKIKSIMKKGAVWLSRSGNTRRLRRANSVLKIDDELHLYVNEAILSQECPAAQLVADQKYYSVWYKPYGMLSQGSKWSDHCTIGRWAEQQLKPERPSFIVHRLDRATSGLMIVAHSKKIAQYFSRAFEKRLVKKNYQAIVWGDHRQRPQPDTISTDVNGKFACSHISTKEYNMSAGLSLVDIVIETGRKHQIRQHLASINYPIVGDRMYSQAEESIDLQLSAFQLCFNCPLTNIVKRYKLADKECLDLEQISAMIIANKFML